MSYSSIWGVDKDYFGEEICTFRNSWLFSPMAWDALFHKYMPNKIGYDGKPASFMSVAMFDNSISKTLNNLINNSEEQADRVVWELSNQQIFFAKDKKFISEMVRRFAEIHAKDLEADHIKERFLEVADSINELDENEYTCFIQKNTSCDDGVEMWFSEWNEEKDESDKKSLKDWKDFIGEFVIVKDGKIETFVSNLEFFGG